jgi:hypothetical protein
VCGRRARRINAVDEKCESGGGLGGWSSCRRRALGNDPSKSRWRITRSGTCPLRVVAPHATSRCACASSHHRAHLSLTHHREADIDTTAALPYITQRPFTPLLLSLCPRAPTIRANHHPRHPLYLLSNSAPARDISDLLGAGNFKIFPTPRTSDWCSSTSASFWIVPRRTHIMFNWAKST